MGQRIFLAGASGAIGRRLAPLLVKAGYTVIGTTRSPGKTEVLSAMGIEPVVVNVFDAEPLARAMIAAQPNVVIHQLTDLPPGVDPARMGEMVVSNARLRTEGTANLVAGALAAGSHRLIAQSIAWTYAPGPEPHGESDPLDLDAEGSRGISVQGVAALEHAVLNTPGLAGLVLRYGRLYGPGTGVDTTPAPPALHVDDAANAAMLAITGGSPGAYNIAEDNSYLSTDKARIELGWKTGFRLP